MLPATAAASAAQHLRPTALLSRRQETARRAKLAQDTVRAAGYLLLTHIALPLLAAVVLMGMAWTRWAMIATLPVSVVLAVAHGFEQRRAPARVVWHLPNAVQVGRRVWQVSDRDLVLTFRHWHHHRVWLWTAVGVAATLWCAVLGALPLAGLVSTCGLFQWLRSQPAPVVHTPPHSAPRIREAMHATGLWKVDALPPFDHLRPPETDDHGSTVWLSLHGRSYVDLLREQHRLVAGFGLRERQLRVDHPDDLPADAVRLAFNNGHPRAPREHWAAGLPRVDWEQPQRLGVDAFGTTHALNTRATHTAFYGKTRSGKTVAARGFVALSLLDPRVQHVVIDGKDDAADWQPMRDLCRAYVGGSTSASLPRIEHALRDLEDESNARAGDKGAGRPIVVVVDEWFRIRAAAKRHDPAAGKRIDALMADLAATCSGRNMHLVFCAQRGTTEYMPGDLAANVGQRVQGWAATPAEVRYSIHATPDVLPSRTGEFLVSTDDGGTAELVVVPYLDDNGFRQVCEAARRLRVPAPVVDELRHDADLDLDDDRPATWQELVAVVLDEAAAPMTTTELHEALSAFDPTVLPTAYPSRFGRFLTADAASERPVVAPAYRGKVKAWCRSESLLPPVQGHEDDAARSTAFLGPLLTAAP